MDTLRHGIRGYRIPAYIEEILTHNYCPYFIRMTIVRDDDSYRFTYRPGRMTKLRTNELDIYSSLVLLRSLISLNEAAESFLITAENYLLEPELVYTDRGSTTEGNIRLMFYPDIKRMNFSTKLMLFSERIRKESGREGQEILSQLRDILESGDINKARIILDKNILRIESRAFNKAG